MRTTEGTLPTDYTFTGQKLDASSGLLYYGARYYDAAIGRFAQPDSIMPNPYNPQSLNRYSYTLNNPVRYTDPTGHCVPEECGGAYGDVDDEGPSMEELFEAYQKVQKEADPEAYRGTLKEYLQGVAVYYYNMWQNGPDSPTTEASSAMLEARQTRLTNNGRYGVNAALQSAYESSGGESTVSFGLAGGLIELGRGALGIGPVARGGTYVLVDPDTGEVVRSGRTGDLKTRQAQHARDPELKDYVFDVDLRTDDYAQQRGREQYLHDKYDPPLNKINPISPLNKLRQLYMDAVKNLMGEY